MHTLKEKSRKSENITSFNGMQVNIYYVKLQTQESPHTHSFGSLPSRLPQNTDNHTVRITKHATLAITTSQNLSTGPISYCPSRQPPLKAQISNLSSNLKISHLSALHK